MDSNQKSAQPLVSIVLNCFNTERFISQQIESILTQTYTNLELIICDDCSTDRTPEIIQEYIKKDPRVKWFQNEYNLGKKHGIEHGVCLTFERGYPLCRGEFIATADADDCWLPEKIQIQVDYLLVHPEVELVFTDSTIANGDLSQHLGSFQKRLGNSSGSRLIPIEALLKRNLPPGHIILFRRSLLPKIAPVPVGFNNDSWIDLAGALNFPLGYIDKTTAIYRQHGANLSGAQMRNLSFYLKRLSDPEFVTYYFKDKSRQMVGHQKLLAFGGNAAALNALREKIANEAVLLAVIQAASFPNFVLKLFSALWAILKSSQKYHLKQLGFLALSWGAIRKLKLDSQKV